MAAPRYIELPEGWAEITLEDAGAWRSGGTPSRRNSEYFGKGIPWVKSGDLPDGPILKTGEEITKLGLDNSAAKLMPAGTISMALYGATIGKLGLMTFPAATNQACANVVPDTRLVEPQFLFNYLLSERRNFIEQGQGGAQPNISQEIVRAHPFPLAPLAEQRRIVAKLEKLLGQVDAGQQRLEKLPTLLKHFRQSVLAAACSGRLTADWREENPNVKPASEVLSQICKEREKVKLRKAKKISGGDEIEIPFDIPKTWALCFFDDLAALKPNAIKAGPFGSSLTKACYVPKGFKVYGQEQVINGDPNFGDYYINEEKFKELQSCEVSAGDILISLVGTIGKVLVIPEKFQPGIINPRLAKFSLHPTIVREYIANYLLSTLAKNILSQQSHGGTMKILNLGIMRKLPIPLAPLAEQQEIVRRVEGLFALADQLESRLSAAQQQVDKLTPSLLARAFAGKLVPQDPNDEPAEKLLERIQKTIKE